jgi:hypothetical protein
MMRRQQKRGGVSGSSDASQMDVSDYARAIVRYFIISRNLRKARVLQMCAIHFYLQPPLTPFCGMLGAP